MVFASPPARDDLVALTRADGVSKVTWLDDHSVRLVVADAGEVSPTLDDWAASGAWKWRVRRRMCRHSTTCSSSWWPRPKMTTRIRIRQTTRLPWRAESTA